jgi:hypothetical protein
VQAKRRQAQLARSLNSQKGAAKGFVSPLAKVMGPAVRGVLCPWLLTGAEYRPAGVLGVDIRGERTNREAGQ